MLHFNSKNIIVDGIIKRECKKCMGIYELRSFFKRTVKYFSKRLQKYATREVYTVDCRSCYLLNEQKLKTLRKQNVTS